MAAASSSSPWLPWPARHCLSRGGKGGVPGGTGGDAEQALHVAAGEQPRRIDQLRSLAARQLAEGGGGAPPALTSRTAGRRGGAAAGAGGGEPSPAVAVQETAPSEIRFGQLRRLFQEQRDLGHPARRDIALLLHAACGRPRGGAGKLPEGRDEAGGGEVDGRPRSGSGSGGAGVERTGGDPHQALELAGADGEGCQLGGGACGGGGALLGPGVAGGVAASAGGKGA